MRENDKIFMENMKKGNGEKPNFMYINLHLKDGLQVEVTADARRSAYHLPSMTRIATTLAPKI